MSPFKAEFSFSQKTGCCSLLASACGKLSGNYARMWKRIQIKKPVKYRAIFLTWSLNIVKVPFKAGLRTHLLTL